MAKPGGKDKPPFPTFEEGHHEVVICEAIAKSIAA